MVAPVTTIVRGPTGPTQQEPPRRTPVCEWRLVDHFNTVEDAERAVEALRLAGVDAELSLVDGLCVLARRSTPVCDPALC